MARKHFAAAPSTILAMVLLASPVPAMLAPTPAPSPTPLSSLAPINEDDDDAGAAATPAPAASGASPQPKVIGHIYTNAYCRDFVEHFNTASTVIVTNDHGFDAVDTTLHSIDADWNRPDGAMRVYDDRVRLIAEVGSMVKSIPVSQSAVNQLLAQAVSTTDPDRKAALREAASQLQRTLDRQRAVADDLTSVIQVLMDKHGREDTVETQVNEVLPAGYHIYFDTGDDPVPEPGTNTLMQPPPSPSPLPGASPTPSPSPSPLPVELVMQWDRQRHIMADAESRAEVAATKLVRICDSAGVPTPPPSPAASVAPSPSP